MKEAKLLFPLNRSLNPSASGTKEPDTTTTRQMPKNIPARPEIRRHIQKERWHKKCLCLVEFEKVQEISPLMFDHQGNMDDWLIIEKIEDVLVGTSIAYNYEKSRF